MSTTTQYGETALNALPGGSEASQSFDALLAQLPEGELKTAMQQSKFGVLGALITLFQGREYQTGQYRLGERFLRHIVQKDPGGYRNVPDEVVPVAQQFFTMALGVDVNNDEDLMSLDSGVDAYFSRPDKQAVPVAAVQRAVAIKKYWPMVKNGQWFVPWPIDIIYSIKSDPVTMGYKSALLGIALPIAMESEKTGELNIESSSGGNKWIWIILAVVLIAGIIWYVKYRKK